MHAVERDFTQVRRSCCQHLMQRPLVREPWKHICCPFVNPFLGIHEQEKCLERCRAEGTGRIDHRLTTLHDLHQVFPTSWLHHVCQQPVDLGIGCGSSDLVEEACEQQQDGTEDCDIEQRQPPTRGRKQRVAQM